jgi:outer membrane protein assembly factor BamB
VTGAAAVSSGRVVVATEAPDVTGAITALDGWTHPLPSAARGGVTVAGGTVFALSVTGALMALDEGTGTARWWRRPAHASERWCLSVPVVADGRVYVGSARGVWAYEAEDGTPIWHTALASVDWTASWSGLAVVDGTVAIGAANDDLHLAALDAQSGELRWKHAGRDIAGVSAVPVIADDQVLAVRIPGWLAAYSLDDGTRRWESALDDGWPVALTAHDGTAFVRTADGTVTAHDVDGGDRRWTCALGPGPRAARPYARTFGGTRAPLVVSGDHLWTSTFDELVGIDLVRGEVASTTAADAELATVVSHGGAVVGVTVDGRLVRSATG